MYEEYSPNEKVVDKAVDLWKKMLANPVYDNGDSSMQGTMCQVLANSIPKNNDGNILNSFGEALKKKLMEKTKRGNYEYYQSTLSVDYHPDHILSEAAEEAGLKMEFPWKTTMHLYKDYVSLGAGYQAPWVNYYPLPDGKWLVTTLSGSDIDKVIEYVKGGKPEFKVE